MSKNITIEITELTVYTGIFFYGAEWKVPPVFETDLVVDNIVS